MHLHEEYISRHNLNVPVVRYDKSSQIIIRSKANPIEWRVISSKWKSSGYHPGYFEFFCQKPIRNSYYRNAIMKDVMVPKKCYWESYERTVLNAVDKLKKDFVAVNEEESVIAAWQIFLLIYDSWLAENMSYEFFAKVSDGLDESSDYISRLSSYRMSILHIKGTDVGYVFDNKIKQLSEKHSKWMEKLINE